MINQIKEATSGELNKDTITKLATILDQLHILYEKNLLKDASYEFARVYPISEDEKYIIEDMRLGDCIEQAPSKDVENSLIKFCLTVMPELELRKIDAWRLLGLTNVLEAHIRRLEFNSLKESIKQNNIAAGGPFSQAISNIGKPSEPAEPKGMSTMFESVVELIDDVNRDS